jgi:transposase-like protein
MSFIQRVGVPLARSMPQFALPITRTYSQTILVALRQFLFFRDNKPSRSLKLLHDAVREDDAMLAETILRTLPSVDVNAIGKDGKLALGIAVEVYAKNDCKYDGMQRVLRDWGACYLLKNKHGETPLAQINKLGTKPSFTVFYLTGSRCGAPTPCTNGCNEETKEYSPELKTQVAMESLTTRLSVNELAKKHGVEDWEVIKWRTQAREEYVRFADRKVKDYSPELEEKAQSINVAMGYCKIVHNLAKKQGVDRTDLKMLYMQDHMNLFAWFEEALLDFFKRTK